MKRILFIFWSLFTLSTSSTMSWALPICPPSPPFHNCYGTFIWDDGNKYVGEWKNNKTHGKGTKTFSDGGEYIGEYKNNKQHGQGTMTWSNGTVFIGNWIDHKRDGTGLTIWANGSKYVGEYKDDKMNGQGIYTYPSGKKDVGEWKNNQLNGYAVKYNADGSIFQEGIFKDDAFQYAQKKPSNSSNSNSKLNKYKEFCEEIGFKLGTEKFADCVLKAMEKD